MELRILSGGAANGLVDGLREAFHQQTGLTISGDFGAVGGMRDRVLASEPVDLIILTQAVVNDLAEAGKVDAVTVTNLGEVVTGVAVCEGAPLSDVSDGEKLRAAFCRASNFYVPDTRKATAGIHFSRVLGELSLAEETSGRIREFPNGQTAMGEMAKSGDITAVGCTQVTEILNTPGVSYAGPLPAPYDLSTVYTAAVASAATSPDAARQLIALLAASEYDEFRRSVGFS